MTSTKPAPPTARPPSAEGEQPKKRAVRPRDAATVVIVRNGAEILMGQRNRRNAFMPDRYVFPGGGVQVSDSRTQPATGLRAPAMAKLRAVYPAARARAVAMAAVRETFEETGLMIGRPGEQVGKSQSPSWREFLGQGIGPTLDVMDYIAHAITPPWRHIRFNTHFFLVDAANTLGELRGNGELINLSWVPFEETKNLDTPTITARVIELARTYTATKPLAADQKHDVLFYREVYGKLHIDFR